MTQPVNLSAYFNRIGYSGSIAPTLATLESLHALHPAAIPFENLSPLMEEPVPLDQKNLERKLLADRRGGYCFEHNHLFWRVLLDLDYAVRGLAARVLWNHPEGAQRPLSHMLLAVDISGATHIVDVGFGGLTLTRPLRLRAGVEQETPHETFRFEESEGNWRLQARLAENDWRTLYVFDLAEFTEADYAPLNRALSTDPASRFRRSLMAALSTRGARHTLLGNRLSLYRPGEPPEHQELADLGSVRKALSETMRISLPPAERLDPALAAVLPFPAPPADASAHENGEGGEGGEDGEG